MKYLVKKLWKGHVSVRDYVVKRCAQDREDLIIDHNGEEMTIPYKSLSNPKQLHAKKIKSKYRGEYTLYDFEWKPEDKTQLGFFKGKD
jgi:hypothetical protein